jgi:TPR repeat protein
MVYRRTTTGSFLRRTFRILGVVRWANAAFLEAADAYERGSRVDAVRRWKVLAADGDDSARFMLRLIGSDPSQFPLPDLARGWLHEAAERGVPAVQQLVGSMYCGGIGVRQDVVMGLSWYHRAADQGHLQAQEHLGWLYLEGLGVAQDHEQGGRWLLLAATQGSIFSCLALGVAYCGGW